MMSLRLLGIDQNTNLIRSKERGLILVEKNKSVTKKKNLNVWSTQTHFLFALRGRRTTNASSFITSTTPRSQERQKSFPPSSSFLSRSSSSSSGLWEKKKRPLAVSKAATDKDDDTQRVTK